MCCAQLTELLIEKFEEKGKEKYVPVIEKLRDSIRVK